MKGVDYAESAARNRAYFQKKINDLKKSYEQNKKNLEESHEYVENRQRNNYEKDRKKLDKSYDDRIEILSKSSKEDFRDLKEDFSRKLENRKLYDAELRKRTAEKNSKSLSDLRSNYTNLLDREKETHEEHLDLTQKKYRDRIDEARTEFAKNYKQAKDISDREIADIKDRSNFNIDRLRKKSQLDKELTEKDLTKKRLDDLRMKDQVIDRIQTMNEASQKDQENRHSRSISDVKRQRDETVTDLTDKFIKDSKMQRRKYLNEKDNMNKEHIDDLNDVEKRHFLNRDLMNKRLAMAQYGNKGKERYLNGVANHKQRQWNKNVANMRKEMEKYQKNAVDQNEKARKDYLENLRKSRVKASNARVNQAKESTDQLIDLKEKYREKELRRNDMFRSETAELKSNYDGKLSRFKKRREMLGQRNMEKLDRSLKNYIEKNNQEVDEIRKHYGDKQRRIVFKKETEKNNLVKNLKENFQEKFLEVNNRYEGKLVKKKLDAEKRENELELRIEELNNKIIKDTERNNKLFKEKHEADREMALNLLKVKDAIYERRFQDMKNGYERKIFSMINDNHRTLKKVKTDLKSKLVEERAERQQEKDRLVRNQRKEMVLVKQHHRLEKDQLISQYEDKIAKLRDEFQYQLDKVRESKNT